LSITKSEQGADPPVVDEPKVDDFGVSAFSQKTPNRSEAERSLPAVAGRSGQNPGALLGFAISLCRSVASSLSFTKQSRVPFPGAFPFVAWSLSLPRVYPPGRVAGRFVAFSDPIGTK